jgi:hypothetical protein
MTNKQILQKAIQKSVNNGWIEPKDKFICAIHEDCYSIYDIIFDHSFAKAFFGQQEVCCSCGCEFTETDEEYGNMGIVHFFNCDCGKDVDPSRVERWQYHLLIMVLEEDPIKYLEAFL